MQGVHLDLTKIEQKVISAANGEESVEDGPEVESDAIVEEGMLVDKHGVHLDKNNILASMSKNLGISFDNKSSFKGKVAKNTGSIDVGLLQPIWDEIQNIPFSEQEFAEEISLLRTAIREVGKDIKAKKIAANTRKLAKNAQKFFQSDIGMRVVFSILGQKFSMFAEGEFSGDEAFYLQASGDSLEGIILKKDESDQLVDVTENFKINIQKAS